MNEREYVKIAVLENPFEAQLLGSILTEEGVPHAIRSYRDTAYDGLFQFQKGWGEVRGPQWQSERILATLEEVRQCDPEDTEAGC